MQELSSLEEKMEYQLEERTRDMQDMLESCQTKVRLLMSYSVGTGVELVIRRYLAAMNV